uniref:MucBP domain-containing protein n=2 Tax=Faecalibaculum rodentium TaxID=1702221 RepID=A0A140DWS7_9FIRM|nr:hypothetical protein AALO17_19700 [Faecalibaculum rodentium]
MVEKKGAELMNRILEAATAAACMLSVMGPSAVFAEEKPAGDTKEHTLEVTYIYPDGTAKAAGELKYKSMEKENAKEGMTYLAMEDLQTFVMKHRPDKGFEADLGEVWFEKDKKEGTKLTLEDTDVSLDTDNLYLDADKDDGNYDIVFYQAPGKVFSQETVKAGDKIQLPEKDPGKDGYVFDGWDLKEGTKAEQNLYLYPKWTQETAQAQGDGVRNVTLTFDPENGQPAQVLTVKAKEAVDASAIAEPAKEGFVFKGWDPEIPATADASQQFHAVYEKEPLPEYTVSWEMDGQVIRTDTVQEGQPTPQAPDVSVPDGYVFKGWDPEIRTNVTENAVYTAKLEALPDEPQAVDMVTISFAGGDQEIAPITVVKGSAIDESTLPKAVKTGYTFTGWTNVPATADRDLTLTAAFTKDEYKIVYRSEGSVVKEFTAGYGDATPQPEAPVREGYEFEGWNPQVAATVTGGAEYNAVWKALPVQDVKIRIQYLEEGTNKELHYANVVEVRTGSAYDVTRFDKPDIKGYTYVKTDGSLTGTADKDATMTVWYAKAKKGTTGTNGTDTSTNTDSALYIGLAAAAAVILVVLLVLKNRKK